RESWAGQPHGVGLSRRSKVVFNSARELLPRSLIWEHQHRRYSHPFRIILTPSARELAITFLSGIGITYVSTIRNRHFETVDKMLISWNSMPGPKFYRGACVLVHRLSYPLGKMQRHAFYDRPTTLRCLLKALETPGREAGARGEENYVRNLLSGEPITCTILRLASTPMPPTAIATLSVHIQCRQVHAVNVHLPGRQQVNDHPWPPTPTEQQQDHTCTSPAQTTHSHHTFHTTNSHWPHNGHTTNTRMICMDPKSTRRYILNRHSETVGKTLVSRNSMLGPKFHRRACVLVHRLSYPLGKTEDIFLRGNRNRP
ncbi:hypothetical protein Taro_053771, partial [Colocasia esculenta]|nr:hypothetical protein [Colocasia esculenta]